MQTEEIVGKMMPRQTYTLPGIDGDLSTDVGKVVMKENDGIDVLASMASFYNKNPALGNSVMILFSTIVILRFQFEFFYWEKWFAVQNVVTVAVLNSTLAEHFSTFTHNQQRRDEEFGRSKLAPLQEAAVNTFDRALLYDCANAKIIEEHSVTNSADLKTSLTFSLGEDVENIMEVAHDFRINYSRSSLRKNLMLFHLWDSGVARQPNHQWEHTIDKAGLPPNAVFDKIFPVSGEHAECTVSIEYL
mmetsp:Transcript_30078/g.75554  ORF Transcript_30078/g.75554 Transcript_30078/m.75554 type:complete len:246 (-) Transcript_30078:207-944(-)